MWIIISGFGFGCLVFFFTWFWRKCTILTEPLKPYVKMTSVAHLHVSKTNWRKSSASFRRMLLENQGTGMLLWVKVQRVMTCVMTNLRKVLPFSEAFHVQLKASRDFLFFIYIYVCISSFFLLSTPRASSTLGASTATGQQYQQLLCKHGLSWLHLLSVGLLPSRE